MARLTAAERRALPSSDFADPEHRAYPMEDASHAADAKRMVAAYGSAKQKAEVAAKAKRVKPGTGLHKVVA